MNRRIISSSLSGSVLAHIASFWLPMLPLICDHIVKVDLSAWIGDIASDCVRIKEALMYLDVVKRNVLKCDSRLCLTCAFFIERVKHASRSIAVRFLHLLRADVNGPPNRSIHREVLIVDVLDQTSAFISGVCLHVNALQRPYHPHVSKGDVLHAVAVTFRRNAANGHSNTKNNRTIFYQEVSGAILSALGLGNDHIIPVLDRKVVEIKSSSRWVDSVGIEGKHNDRSFYGEPFEEIDLCSCIDLDVDVVEQAIVAVVQLHVELC